MRKETIKRIEALEKFDVFIDGEITSHFCPHTFYVGETAPCEACEFGNERRRACIRSFLPGKREQ
jgi:hypothetical protein